jgi:16S rRNA (adenine1518-N6/adenine1519-N6)-dimethyltransferase
MNHRPRKRFGQHFLHDQGVIRRIVDAVNPSAGDVIVEIGPGEGVLTRQLFSRCRQLHALEIDRDLATSLKRDFIDEPSVSIHQADALKFDICSLAQAGHAIRLVGNLPYNISTPLLFHFLHHGQCLQDMHFMLQKEVVDRLVSVPGTKTYGRLSVIIQMLCETESLFEIGPGAFRPPPRVWSAVVRLRPRSIPMVEPDRIPDLEKLTQQVFSQRRKTLRKSLQGTVSADSLKKNGIDSSRRPETLSLTDWLTLLRLYIGSR